MKVIVDVGDGFDIAVVVDWLKDKCPSFVQYQIIEVAWEIERTDDDPWFQMEVEFDDETDAVKFILKWGQYANQCSKTRTIELVGET